MHDGTADAVCNAVLHDNPYDPHTLQEIVSQQRRLQRGVVSSHCTPRPAARGGLLTAGNPRPVAKNRLYRRRESCMYGAP